MTILKRLASVLLLSALVPPGVTCALAQTRPIAPATQPADPTTPNPQLHARDVVRIVVEALGRNGTDDAGIRVAWNFASPDNKKMTGPIERFIPMVKNPAYAPLLHFKQATFGRMRHMDNRAAELVVVTDSAGHDAWFIFQLSRQTDGALNGCWMTDGVMRVQPRKLAPPATQPNQEQPPALPVGPTA